MENENIEDEIILTEDEVVEETVEEKPKKVFTKEEQLAIHNREAKKLRKELGIETEPKKPTETEATKPNLSQTDVIYLAKADIHEEDMDEVVEYANLKKIPVKQAHEFMKPILNQRAEERKTAEATHSGVAKRTTQKVSEEAILERASEGKLPESEEDIKKLAQARINAKKAR